MFNKSLKMAVPFVAGLMLLGACATTNGSTAATQKVAEPESAKTIADDLTQTKRTTQSEDGKMICKRTQVVGSKFNKKVCATAAAWAARAEDDQRTTSTIQRSAGPGTSN